MNIAPTNKLDDKTWIDLAEGVKSLITAEGFALQCAAHEDKRLRHEQPDLIVDTSFAPDTGFWETAISCRTYNGGKWIAVTQYASGKKAKIGHRLWVKTMTAECLPVELTEIYKGESYQREGTE